MESAWIVGGVIAVVVIIGVAMWWTRPATWQDGERRRSGASDFLGFLGDLLWFWWVW